uniref:Uncharacterized protein n=1 Tax=Urocitellus parryii TaxID=9999 RepID=A0A8D2IAA6_UROPR
MPGFHKFLEKPKQWLLCLLCRKPMHEPVQDSTLGQCFCNTCLQELLSERVPWTISLSGSLPVVSLYPC